MRTTGELERTLAETEAILLDFDGPVCSVFAGHPAPAVAAELRKLLAGMGVSSDAVRHESDPMAILGWTASLQRTEITEVVEEALCNAELIAVDSASPTPYSSDLIVAGHRAGRPLAIVSNNSAPAIRNYLAKHRLTDYFVTVIGRPYAQPSLMKPHPEPILRGVQAVHSIPPRCVLVGDSLSDIQGGKAAGVRVIGYANKPGKAQTFTDADADAMVTSLDQLVVALT